MSTADAREYEDDDPFTVLGVSRSCTLSELKQVYRDLARRYHPDVNPGPEAAARMKRINLAYDRALELLERAERRRIARASAMTAGTVMTVATQPRGPQDSGIARVFGSGVRVARAARRRRGHKRILWLSAVASVAVAALVILVIFRVFRAPVSSSANTSGAHSPTLHLNSATSLNWQGDGAVTATERLILQLPAHVQLNEAPEWSADGAYVAISVSPTGSSGSAASAASTILVAHDGRIVAQAPGASARWSPQADQLAVLTGPDSGNGPLLELVSPLAPGAPTILDTGVATHLAWSDDGTLIAYSANGQQHLRVASIGRGSSKAVIKTLQRKPGERLIPLGWQGAQVVEIVHNGGAISLMGVDTLHDNQITTLADLDALASETTVAIAPDGIAYISQTGGSPFVTFHWLAPQPQQPWSAQLSGVPSVRFLAGWSANGGWMALAPAASFSGSSATASDICFAHAPHLSGATVTQWPLHCLSIPGVVEGMSWEPQSSTLSYVRAAHPGGRLELRALRIEATGATSAQASMGESVLVERDALPGPASASIIAERIRRHSCCGAESLLLRSPQVGPTINDPIHRIRRSVWAHRSSA